MRYIYLDSAAERATVGGVAYAGVRRRSHAPARCSGGQAALRQAVLPLIREFELSNERRQRRRRHSREFETRLSRTRGLIPPSTLLYNSIDGDDRHPLTSLPQIPISEPRSTSALFSVAYMSLIFALANRGCHLCSHL